MRRTAVSLLVLALVGVGCTNGTSALQSPSSSLSPSATSSPSGTPAPSPTPDLAHVSIRLVHVAKLSEPLAMAVRTGDDALYVAQKTGRVVVIRNGKVDLTPVLDLSAKTSGGGEQGLLGIAFSPDGSHLYASYTDGNGDTNVVEYAMTGDRANASSARRVLFVSQPYANHNGGNILFGPDGYLYLGLGDGGSEGDPLGTGQDMGTLLGKMLRIDPHASGGKAYTIPPDNPFVGKSGIKPEIWASGLRNPWRFSFDLLTGDLWIGDVGQNTWEEVDFQPGGSKGGQTTPWGRSTSTTTRPAGAWSRAGTSTGEATSARSTAPTCSPTTAPGS
ncbi:MAG: PQQ-dependent sugar dehydrogenase [Actinobacteria bacterium]|nr:MAG: PQQ-dependent sugar dehydrogenase [Actinomycetota bacterium]